MDEYLKQHPEVAAELRQILTVSLPRVATPPANLEEMESLRRARRAVRMRASLMGFAIFFSLTPFSFSHNERVNHFMIRDSPGEALIFGSIAVALWVAYYILRRRSGSA